MADSSAGLGAGVGVGVGAGAGDSLGGGGNGGVIVFEPLNLDKGSAKLIWPAPETEEYVEFQDWVWNFSW
ncbi:unnamed protein product [marine sediment metagenome]|uniref:Uncharacterized protein n=1 Tax=marine sediment metagenome TaxID=412755 RepID=X1EIN4_9ZZZZ